MRIAKWNLMFAACLLLIVAIGLLPGCGAPQSTCTLVASDAAIYVAESLPAAVAAPGADANKIGADATKLLTDAQTALQQAKTMSPEIVSQDAQYVLQALNQLIPLVPQIVAIFRAAPKGLDVASPAGGGAGVPLAVKQGAMQQVLQEIEFRLGGLQKK
jgi:hypothetical protein